MNYSRQRAVSDGTLQTLAISIGYFKRGDLSVLFDGVQFDEWGWLGSLNTIQFNTPVPAGVEITVVRDTQRAKVIHEFAKGAAFTNTAMDDDFRQMLYLSQEYLEGSAPPEFFSDVDLHGFQLNNLADGTAPGDAVNLSQLTAATQDSAATLRAELALASGSSLVGHSGSTVADVLDSHTVAIDVLSRNVINVADPAYAGGAKGDGTTDDTLAFQAALSAYHAATVSYQATSPNVHVYSGPELIIPAGRYVCGALAYAGGALRIAAHGAILLVKPGVVWMTCGDVTVVDVSGLSLCGGATHFRVGNNNSDGSVYTFTSVSFHDTTDWPVIAIPTTPGGQYEVNHLSGSMAFLGNCRWYNTNGMFKSYFDRTTVRDAYPTLFAVASGGRWQANRAAIESRSLGDGVILDNLFAVAIAQNGKFGNAWVDNYPGDNGWVLGSTGGAFDSEFKAGYNSVAYGGGVLATGCRFGTEDGGVPIVRNYAHGLAGTTGNGFGTVFIVLDNCFQLASGNGGTPPNTGSVILKRGVPNAITIRNCKGPVGEPLINASSMIAIDGSPVSLAYWLDPVRCGNYRATVDITGINYAVDGYYPLVPAELVPFASYEMSEDGRTRRQHTPIMDNPRIKGSVSMHTDRVEALIHGDVFGGAIRIRGNSAAATDRGVWLGRTDSSGNWSGFLKVDADTASTEPGEDNSYSLGSASKRWSTVYSGTGAVNTSDANCKQDIQDIPEELLKAWGSVKFQMFKFRDAVEIKGDGSRWHFGVVAQEVEAAFQRAGVDPFAYGILCYDEDPYAPEGGRYGIRYEEALVLECAYLRYRLEV